MANVDFDKKPDGSAGVKVWKARIADRIKDEKDFRKDGRSITKLYEDGKEKEGCTPFNILYSNTETLSPALYNNQPRPVVERRFKDADPVGKEASTVMKRILEYLLDSNDQDYSDFDSMMRMAVLEGLLPGRGVTRFKYDADVSDDAEGKPAAVNKEMVCGEEVAWDRIVFGYAKRWVDTPWMAILHLMDRQEVEANFSPSPAAMKEIAFEVKPCADADDATKEGDMPNKAEDADSPFALAQIWEIWDKGSRKVRFIADGHDAYLKELDDPLNLSGFFPIPKPLRFMQKISTLTPTALYKMYEEQATELNIITVRLKAVTRALKVRGFYDATLGDLEQLLASDDNVLLPAQNVGAMLQGQTLDKAIMLMPIEKLVTVLNQLVMQRDQVKQTIYEITGISDILRGAGRASESATQSELKGQWGTLRLKRMQKEVQRYVRDCLRIMAEIAVSKLSPGTIAAMTGLNYPSQAMKQQAQAMLPQLQATGQQPPPEVAEMLSKPTWEEILGLLQDDLQRNYRIDIETNSTVDADATEDKQDVAEIMNAIAQFMNGVAPMLESGYLTFDVAKSMLLSIVRRFRFGTEIEDQIKGMKPPEPKEDPKVAGEKAKLEADQQRMQSEMARDKQKADLEMQVAQAEVQLKLQELEIKKMELDMKAQELQMKHQMAQADMQLKAVGQAQAQEQQTVAHQNSMEQMAEKRAFDQQAAKDQQGEKDASV